MKSQIPPHRWLVWAGLFLIVVGAKLWCIDLAGSDVPYRDQIDAEGETIIRPWAEGRLEIGAFFEPHNEHRVVFTRLIAWAVVATNGQWDAYIQVVLNAVIHAAFLIIVLLWIGQRMSGWRLTLFGTVINALWVLPLDWENTIQGFQSQVYLVLIFSFLHLRGVLGATRFGWRWTLGNVCGVLSLGAMAGGVLSSAAILIVGVARIWRRREVSHFQYWTLGLSLVIAIIGLASRTTVSAHAGLRAQNLAELWHALTSVWRGRSAMDCLGRLFWESRQSGWRFAC